MTRTGQPIDGILSSICVLPAYPDQYDLSVGYTYITNLLHFSSVILLVTRVDVQSEEEKAIRMTKILENVLQLYERNIILKQFHNQCLHHNDSNVLDLEI